MIRRARLIAVVTTLLCGAVGVISSTQTWLDVTLRAGGDTLPVAGVDAIHVLAPVCLAVLALGAALSIVGTALRYVFGVLTTGAAVALLWLTVPIVFAQPVAAVAPTVTTATGIAGADSVSGLIADIAVTPWPPISLVVWLVLLAAGIFTLATAHSWRRGGRRFATDGRAEGKATNEPLDAIDSWDDLSHGEDPTR